MAIIWADFPSGQRGLYDNNTAYMLNGVWGEISGGALVNDPDPAIGAAGIAFQGGFSAAFPELRGARFAYPIPATTQGLGVRMWLANLPVNNDFTAAISFRNAANATMVTMRVLTTGAIEFRSADGNSGTQFGVTAGPVVVANAYNHIEIKILSHASAGTIELRVNGAVKLALAGLNTDGANIAQFAIGHNCGFSTNATTTAYYKDLVLWDTSGAYGNDFQGSVAVHDLIPNADISLNWTPSSGATGWDLIDERPPNDADYVAAPDPPPAAAVFGLTNLPPDVTSVRALLPIMRAFKSDGGDCNIQMGLTPNNVAWVNGANRPMTTAFTYWWDAIHTSPVTAVPWTVAEVNAAYARVNRTL